MLLHQVLTEVNPVSQLIKKHQQYFPHIMIRHQSGTTPPIPTSRAIALRGGIKKQPAQRTDLQSIRCGQELYPIFYRCQRLRIGLLTSKVLPGIGIKFTNPGKAKFSPSLAFIFGSSALRG